MEAFHTIVIGLGYHDSGWKQYIVDKADEYKEEEIENAIDRGLYEPSPELRRVAEEYVKILEEQKIDEALAEHNAHEEGFDLDDDDYDDYGQKIEPNEALMKAAKKYKKNKAKKK
jgi:hypothetical protein